MAYHYLLVPNITQTDHRSTEATHQASHSAASLFLAEETSGRYTCLLLTRTASQ